MTQLIVFGGSAKEVKVFLDMVEEITQSGEKVVLLLIHGACELAMDRAFCEKVWRHGAHLYVLGEDLNLQELPHRVVDGVVIADYDTWVRLLESCEKVFSWT